MADHPDHYDPAETTELRVGDRVQKVKGYPFPGVVRASFATLSGKQRYVVECTAQGVEGCLHIFNREQLERRDGG